MHTNGLVDLVFVCSGCFLLQALNPEASPWIPTKSVRNDVESLPQLDYSSTSSDYQEFFSSCASSTYSSLSSSPKNNDFYGYDYRENDMIILIVINIFY